MAAAALLAAYLTLWDTAHTALAEEWTIRPPASALQEAVWHSMAGKRGVAVVIEVATGKILAGGDLSVAARRRALPGSSLKPFTLLALIEAGKVDPQTTLMCKRPLTIGGHNFDCTHPDMKQPLDPAMALAYSCNSYFTTLATRLTPSELRDELLTYGFGSPSGLLPNEDTGGIVKASSEPELQMEAIGEWGVRATPLQLLHAYQRLALLSQKHDQKLAPVFAGLEGSVTYGMGHLAQPEGSMRVAGKTGTSLVEEGNWRHGWFAGYAPSDKPEIALVVFLEKGNGPVDAASVARELFAAYASERVSGNTPKAAR
jgi:penicillin-binding protein 2